MIRLSTIAICLFLFLTFGLNGQTNKSTENFPGNIQLKSGSNPGLILDGGIPSTFSNILSSTPSSITLQDGTVARISMSADQPGGPPFFFPDNVPLVTLTGNVPGASVTSDPLNGSKTFMTFLNDEANTDSWNFNLALPIVGGGTTGGTEFQFVYKSGSTSILSASISSTGGISSSSDRRLKTNIETIQSALPSLMKLNATHYNRKINLDKGEYGFIAQEVEKVLPDMVSIHSTETGEQYMMNYTQLIPILTKGMQEQQGIITDQKEKISDLQLQINQLNVQMKELKELLVK